MPAALPKAASISRSIRCAPSDSDGAPPRDPACPQHAGSSLSLAIAAPPQRDRQLRPSRPPTAYGSSPSTPLRPQRSGVVSFGSARAAAIRSSSRASAHASFLRFSVIGSPRSSDSSPVASERRRSTPPQPASTSLSVPSTPRSWRLGPRLSSLGLVFSGRPQAASHPPQDQRPLPKDDPRDPTSPPSTKRSRASEPRRQPQGGGARPFFWPRVPPTVVAGFFGPEPAPWLAGAGECG